MILKAPKCTVLSTIPQNINSESLGGEFEWAREKEPNCWFVHLKQNCSL